MDRVELVHRRLSTVGLIGLPGGGHALDGPADVVGWFGAAQSQDYRLATWALAQRLGGGVTHSDLDHGFADGDILRTHVLRPTWHFVTPADIRWLLELTAPRVHALNAYAYRQFELDDTLLRRAAQLIADALADRNWLTRAQVAAALDRAGIVAERFRLAYILMYAELERVVCSGPLAGKQHTYARLDERAPGARSLDRDAALAEVTRRYFTSHGPATTKDFSWWSSLTLADIAAGLALVGDELESMDVDGVTYWWAPSAVYPPAPARTVQLLQPYDEYIVGYSQSKVLLDLDCVTSTTSRPVAGRYNGVIILDTQVAGHWKRTLTKNEVTVHAALYRPFDAAESQALQGAADGFGAFLGRAATVEMNRL